MGTSRHITAILLSAALLALGCSGGSEPATPDVGTSPPPAPPSPSLPPPPATGGWYGVDRDGSYDVRETRAVVFTRGLVDRDAPKHMDLHLELYEPGVDLTGSELPAVVLVHGGGFIQGSRNNVDIRRFGNMFAQQGFLAISIDYRLIPDDPVLSSRYQQALTSLGVSASRESSARVQLAAVEDSIAAIDWLHETAAANDYRIKGVAVLGESAGAFTVINLAYVIDDFGLDSPRIDAVIGLWGGIGLGSSSAITADEAPILMVHGTGDTIVNYQGSLGIANRAAAIGLPYELILNAGAGHSFPENDLFTLRTMPGSGLTQAQRIIDFVGVAILAGNCLRQQGVIDACPLPD